MKVCLFLIFFLSLSIISIYAIPASYNDEADGWIQCMISYHLVFNQNASALGFELNWISKENIGVGITISGGDKANLWTINGIYYINIPEVFDLAFPIKARLGVFGIHDSLWDWGGVLTAGVEYFFGHWDGVYKLDPNEEFNLNLLAAIGIGISGKKIIPIGEVCSGISLGIPYNPSSVSYY